jgi:CubicO group peptidase (beta-lactamase class C family)
MAGPGRVRKTIRKWLRRVAVVAGCSVLASDLGGAGPLGQLESLDRFCDSTMAVQLEKHHIPGAVLIVVHDGHVLLARGYGYADLEQRVPVDPERTAFRVASVSKLVTATAAMQLVERGKLDLHRDVNRTLRRFQVARRPDQPVTLFHLLTHTAGFDDRNIERKARGAAGPESLGAYLARRMPPRVMPAGEFISYSNHGMALAGYLVEEASGLPFDTYVVEHIFRPLGMERSRFSDAGPGSDRAVGYRYGRAGFERVGFDVIRTGPASMLSTTGSDMARFMIAHLAEGRLGSARILDQATARAMHARQFTQHPLLPGIGFGFWERIQNGERAIWHDGDFNGFSSLLVLLPERDLGIFVACNSRGGGMARREFFDAFLDRYAPDPARVERPIAPFERRLPLSRFAGTYLNNRYGHRSLEKLSTLEAQLEVRAASGSALLFQGHPYVRVAPLLFRRSDGPGVLAFRANPSGRITHLFAGTSIARVYERLPWYASAGFLAAAIGFCILAFLSACFAWVVRVVRRPVGGARSASPSPGSRGLAAVVGALNLVFLVGILAFLLGSPEDLEYRVPARFVALLVVPLVTTALGLVVVARTIAAWKEGRGSRLQRLHASWLATAALGFAAILLHLNLLGFHF